MKIEIHIHHHSDNHLIIQKFDQLMAKADDIKALVSGINDSTNNIAADLERIAGSVAGGLTAEEADGVIADLKTAADKLKAVADINPESPAPTA